jgi:hypothetical protein
MIARRLRSGNPRDAGDRALAGRDSRLEAEMLEKLTVEQAKHIATWPARRDKYATGAFRRFRRTDSASRSRRAGSTTPVAPSALNLCRPISRPGWPFAKRLPITERGACRAPGTGLARAWRICAQGLGRGCDRRGNGAGVRHRCHRRTARSSRYPYEGPIRTCTLVMTTLRSDTLLRAASVRLNSQRILSRDRHREASQL